MKRIKNKLYRQFLDEGEIQPIEEEDLIDMLDKVDGKFKDQFRALAICLYYTGCRPVELFRIKAGDIKAKGHYIIIWLGPSKRGKPRNVYLKKSLSLVRELYDYSRTLLKENILFWKFKGSYMRKVKMKDGSIKEREETTANLRYWFDKYFGNSKFPICPYFLRHNRYSKLSIEGVRMEEAMIMKGSKSIKSMEPYMHLSAYEAKKIAKVNR